MLWKKESNKPNALYTDIFAQSGLDMEEKFHEYMRKFEKKPHPQKDDAVALQKRNDGNAAFRRKAYDEAMELYNDSLRFAKPESGLIGLAYANRSACFLKLKMFEKCLNDIKLAKGADYPAHLMPKLEQRQTECLERLDNGENSHSNVRAELSFEPNKNFPSMANALKVQVQQTGSDGNCAVVAKQDIDVGQTIVVEDAMFAYLHDRLGLKCNICLKDGENLVPCKKCAIAMFCPDCQGHFLHEYECGLNLCGGCRTNSGFLSDVRTILLTCKMFPSVDELMAFVERIQNKKEMPTHLTDFPSKYQVYYNSERRHNIFSTHAELLALLTYPKYRTILLVPQIKAMFQSRKHLRFLMHLIADTSFISNELILEKKVNQVTVTSNANPNVTHLASVVVENSDEPMYDAHYPLMDYFPHSCFSNALRFIENGQTVMVTTRPIKKGEKVFKSKIPIEFDPKQQKSAPTCECSDCSRCNGVLADPEQRRQLSSEPTFIELMENWTDKGKKTMENCAALLQKYGRLNWCDEIKLVLSVYHYCLRNRANCL